MKTYRDLINSRLRWHPWLVPYIPILAGVCLGATLIRFELIWLGITFAFVLAAWGIYASQKLGKCPKCGTELFTLFGYHRKINFSRSLLPEKIKYCPVCGLDFDLPHTEETSDPKP